MTWKFLRTAALLIALAVAGCSLPGGNPLIGHWAITVPDTGVALGTCDFTPSHMSAFGIDADVDYQVSGDKVTVLPRQLGIGIQVTMLDRDTARLATPMIGNLVELKRIQ
jgi:hypothetical protein